METISRSSRRLRNAQENQTSGCSRCQCAIGRPAHHGRLLSYDSCKVVLDNADRSSDGKDGLAGVHESVSLIAAISVILCRLQICRLTKDKSTRTLPLPRHGNIYSRSHQRKQNSARQRRQTGSLSIAPCSHHRRICHGERSFKS